MAMTKHFIVTFDVTAVIDSESEKNLNELLVDLAKEAGAGEKLEKDLEFLNALRACGVDNWDGYSDAVEMVYGEDDE